MDDIHEKACDLVKRLIRESDFQLESFLEYLDDFKIQSSSHVNWASQSEAWNAMANAMKVSVNQLAVQAAQVNEGFPGVEGLWIITQNEHLWPLTDFANVSVTDQLAVSYFYGNEERLQAFKKYSSDSPSAMAASIAHCFEGTSSLTTAYINPAHAQSFELNEIVHGIKKHWDIVVERNTGDNSNQYPVKVTVNGLIGKEVKKPNQLLQPHPSSKGYIIYLSHPSMGQRQLVKVKHLASPNQSGRIDFYVQLTPPSSDPKEPLHIPLVYPSIFYFEVNNMTLPDWITLNSPWCNAMEMIHPPKPTNMVYRGKIPYWVNNGLTKLG